MTRISRRSRRVLTAVTAVGVAASLLAGCSSGSSSSSASSSSSSSSSGSSSGSSSAGSSAASSAGTSAGSVSGTSGGGSTSGAAALGPGSNSLSYLGQTENTTIAAKLKSLATSSCADAAKNAPVDASSTATTAYDQKLQLLAGQDALPSMLMVSGTPALTKQLISAGKLENLTPQLESLGVADQILPAARSTITALYGSKDLYVLPTEFNIEGIWYNKKLFSDKGVTVPTTWDELVAAAAKFKAAGVQPMSADGKDGWPITRLVGDYIFRDLGADALQQVADGKAKLTDPGYVKAASAVADLGKSGAFGDAVGSIDYNTAFNTFLTGKAAMFYMGSWALGNFNDPKQNKIGADNIGFMPFPAVTGGKGNIDQMPSNIGVPVAFSAKNYGTNIAAWVKCIAGNYGTSVLASDSVISGFKSTAPAAETAIAKSTEATIAKTTSTVLWFEALFNAKASSISQSNAAPLINGSMSPDQFMAAVQAANAAS